LRFSLVCVGNQKDDRPVDPAQLVKIIGEADKIVVTEGPLADAKMVYTSSSRKDILEFRDALTVIRPKQWFHCMCLGAPAIRLYRGDKELVLISSHHGRSVRCSLWTSDAEVSDQEKWVSWFDVRGMPELRREVEAMASAAKGREASYLRWRTAMPKSLKPLWESATRDPFAPDLKVLEDALAKEIPDTRERVLALFGWFGSGAGPWSGFPMYESIAEELLVKLPVSDLVSAAETDDLSEQQREGAARLFSSWPFQRRPGDKTLPPALKKKLLAHCLKTGDQDKRDRAKKALAPQ
jgi:hypothetical protein